MADGGGAGDGGGAEVSSVSPGDGVGDRLEGPVAQIGSVVVFLSGFWGRGSHSLAVGLAASDGDLDGSAWALGLSDLLGDKSDTTLLALSWEDTDGLSINQYSFPIPDIPSPFSRSRIVDMRIPCR